MSRNQFYLEEDIRKIARLECSGLAKNEIIKKLNRRVRTSFGWSDFVKYRIETKDVVSILNIRNNHGATS